MLYKLLCKLGIHMKYLIGHEDSKTSKEYKVFQSCDCGEHKEYDFNGEWIDDNTSVIVNK